VELAESYLHGAENLEEDEDVGNSVNLTCFDLLQKMAFEGMIVHQTASSYDTMVLSKNESLER
jgi:hypothetical protein